MTPHQFVRIQIRGVAGKEVQRQFAADRLHVFLDHRLLVRGQTVHDQVKPTLAMTHQLLEQFNKPRAIERALVGTKPEGPARIERRGGRNRLALPRPVHHRRLAAQPPGLAMHRVSPKPGLIPEEDVRALALGSTGDRGIDLALPALDRLRVALVGALQRLLRREPEFREQRANRSDTQADAELAFDQQRDDASRPQTEVQSVLARVASIDPAKDLTLLRRGQTARATRAAGRAQRPQAPASSRGSLEPFIDHRAVEAERCDHDRGFLAFAYPLHCHAPDLFERLVIKRASVSLHAFFDWFLYRHLNYGLVSNACSQADPRPGGMIVVAALQLVGSLSRMRPRGRHACQTLPLGVRSVEQRRGPGESNCRSRVRAHPWNLMRIMPPQGSVDQPVSSLPAV